MFVSRLPAGLLMLAMLWSSAADAIPVFARQYEISCNVCHAAFPRLNAFGVEFAAMNMRLPNWRERLALTAGDEMLALPREVPLAIRAQAFVQWREAEEVEPGTGFTGNDASFDFQAPYLIKLLSSAPLSDHISYYFYAIFAEKGENGTVLVEDAWFSHDDVFGTGVAAQLGQFQLSDLMFPRETRLTFQDFQVYRMAQVTYDRGLILSRDVWPGDLALGFVNGNGIEENFPVNSPGYRRPDRMFDNDTAKTVFGHVAADVRGISLGLFGLVGEQRSAAGPLGTAEGERDTDRFAAGVDVSGQVGAKLYWFGQVLWNRWENFLEVAPERDFEWTGGFAGIDYIYSDRWAYSLLYNLNDAGDFADTGTIFEGIDMNSLTAAVSYYFMRNVKGVIEANVDFLSAEDDPNFVGHLTREHYVLFGIDAAF